MNEQIEQPTVEEIARHYAAAMDSVNLINGDKPEHTSDEDWADTLERNAAHLEIMVAKDSGPQKILHHLLLLSLQQEHK